MQLSCLYIIIIIVSFSIISVTQAAPRGGWLIATLAWGWIRTTDLWLMRPTSYPCSTPQWRLRRDLNPWPLEWQSSILTKAELRSHMNRFSTAVRITYQPVCKLKLFIFNPNRKIHKHKEYTTVFGFPVETSEEYIRQSRKSTQSGCVPTSYATKAS